MKYVDMVAVIVLALLALPLEADAQSENLTLWGGAGLGGSSFGFSSSADLTVAKGSIAGGLMGFATASGPIFGGFGPPRDLRSMSGLRLGMLKTAKTYKHGIYLGLGKLSGETPDEDYCNYFGGSPEEDQRPSTFFGCTRDLKKTTAIAVMAEFMWHSRIIGVSLKPFLIYGNSEFWPGLTVQLVVGILR